LRVERGELETDLLDGRDEARIERLSRGTIHVASPVQQPLHTGIGERFAKPRRQVLDLALPRIQPIPPAGAGAVGVNG
jgi:hypothetical protein